MKLKTKSNLILMLLFAPILAGTLFLTALPIHADNGGLVPCGNNDQQNIKNSAQTFYNASDTCKLGDIFKLIARVVNYLIGAAGIYAVVRILMGSFQLITASGNEEQISGGKSTLRNALVGLVLVFVAYAIVNTIFGVFAPKIGVSSNGFLYNPFN